MGTNKHFDNILNECLEKLITGQETVEQCLKCYPEYAKELEPLLRTASMVNKVVDVKPSAEFRAKTRYEMQLKMAQSKAPVKAPVRVARYVPRWAVAVATVVLVFVLGGGTILASGGVMPGNLLYGVKLAKENVQVKLAGSTEKKTELYVTMAAHRVAEISWMASNNKTQDMEAAAVRLDNYYNQIGKLALAGNNSTYTSNFSLAGPTSEIHTGSMTQAATTQASGGGKSAPPVPDASTTTALSTVTTTAAATVVTPAPVTTTTLAAILPYTTPPTTAVTTTKVDILPITIPPATSTVITITQPITTFAVTAPASSFRWGSQDISGGSNNQVATNNGLTLSAGNYSNLMNILLYNAVTQPEAIQKLLDSDKVPESVKPALRRALAASLINYQNAISNFSAPGNNSGTPGNP